MRVSMKMLFVGLAVVVSLSAGPAWSQERDPVKELGLHVDKVLEGSEEIKAGEDTGEPTPRGIYGMVIVANYTEVFLYVSRGSNCNNHLGIVPPGTRNIPNIVPLAVGDWQGSTKLCAKTANLIPARTYRQTVTGSHLTYRWNIR